MASTYVPLNLRQGVNTSEAAGSLTYNKFKFDLASPQVVDANNVVTSLAAIVINDLIQVGVVPAGEILVPHLCRLGFPQVDSNGSPTGTFVLGIVGTTNALLTTKNAQTAAEYTAEDFALSTAEVGSDSADTPIYLKFTAAVATLAATGVIAFHQVTRPWNSSTDGASTT